MLVSYGTVFQKNMSSRLRLRGPNSGCLIKSCVISNKDKLVNVSEL